MYSLKSVKTPIDLPPRPIQTITTPNGEVVDIPPKGVDTSYELKWWQYLLMAVPFLLAFLYYLIKKILKNRILEKFKTKVIEIWDKFVVFLFKKWLSIPVWAWLLFPIIIIIILAFFIGSKVKKNPI
ncbi:hypothetical protein [Tenacibaculum maritimum]|uniref:hypothetical protein n=1 Tax=Tenacibaculum maritimum TaxID=107401 RepID=UPI00388E81E5